MKHAHRVAAIIVAAGAGKRFGAAKHQAQLAGKPVLEWTLTAFQQHAEVSEIILVIKDTYVATSYEDTYSKLQAVVQGGAERQDSVWAGFQQLRLDENDIVLVHDGVRPLVTGELISRIIQAAKQSQAVVPVLPVEDTLKHVHNGKILKTPDRSQFFRSQTPQGFQYALLDSAIKKAQADKYYGTDEAELVERMREEVVVVPGEQENIKITTPLDIKIAEAYLESQNRNRI